MNLGILTSGRSKKHALDSQMVPSRPCDDRKPTLILPPAQWVILFTRGLEHVVEEVIARRSRTTVPFAISP